LGGGSTTCKVISSSDEGGSGEVAGRSVSLQRSTPVVDFWAKAYAPRRTLVTAFAGEGEDARCTLRGQGRLNFAEPHPKGSHGASSSFRKPNVIR